jgi:hypothetical protein
MNMNHEAQTYIDESKITVDRIRRDVTAAGSITAADAGLLFRLGFEYPLKAIVAQKYGHVPKEFQIHPLAKLTEQIGITGFIPSEVNSGMAHIKGWHLTYPDQKVFDTLIQSSSAAQWLRTIDAAEKHREFIVKEVLIGSSSIYPKLFSKP